MSHGFDYAEFFRVWYESDKKYGRVQPDEPIAESPYNDAEVLALLDNPLIRRPVPTALRYQSGRSFFYYHEQCANPEQHAYAQVSLAGCAPDTTCCGCWGTVHDAPVV